VPQGFQVFDASGNLILDATDSIAKILGGGNIGSSFTGSTQSGSIFDTRLTQFAGHTPFAAIIRGDTWNMQTSPKITFSGNSLLWNFPHATLRPDTSFIYGVAG
jgi:hypothetical protein